MPINEPNGNMIVEIGGGTTEIAVLSLGSMVKSKSVRVGGNKIDEAIIKHMLKEHNIHIGERTAEEIKITIGNAFKGDISKTIDIKGRNSISGLPKTERVNSAEVRDAIIDILTEILEAIKSVLNETPPEIAADIVERGIVMSGGTSLLQGFTDLVSEQTEVPVILADNPLTCVAIGCGKFIEETKNLKSYRRYS